MKALLLVLISIFLYAPMASAADVALAEVYRLLQGPSDALEAKDFSVTVLQDEFPVRGRFKKFDPKSHKALQNWIDSALLKILSTPTAKKHLAGASSFPDSLVSSLGMSQEAAEAFTGRRVLPPEQIPSDVDFGERLRLHLQEALNNELSTRYVFYFFNGDAPSWDSWSDEVNRTKIFLNAQTLSTDHLIKILAHEVAIRMDAKAFSLQWLIEDLIKKQGVASIPSKAFEILNNRAVYRSFRVLRAFRFESDVISDWKMSQGQKPSTFASGMQSLDSKSCLSWLSRLISYQFANGFATASGTEAEVQKKIKHLDDLCVSLSEYDLNLTKPFQGAGPRPGSRGGFDGG